MEPQGRESEHADADREERTQLGLEDAEPFNDPEMPGHFAEIRALTFGAAVMTRVQAISYAYAPTGEFEASQRMALDVAF